MALVLVARHRDPVHVTIAAATTVRGAEVAALIVAPAKRKRKETCTPILRDHGAERRMGTETVA